MGGVTAVAAGQYSSVALKNDGTLVAWGDQGITPSGSLVPVGSTRVTAIAASRDEAWGMALKNDGSVVWWGALDQKRAASN